MSALEGRTLNRAEIIGNVANDPELRVTSDGSKLCTFGVITNEFWITSSGEKREHSEYHNIVAWDKVAEVCFDIAHKGALVYIDGSMRSREISDIQGSSKRIKHEIKLQTIKLLDAKKEKTNEAKKSKSK